MLTLFRKPTADVQPDVAAVRRHHLPERHVEDLIGNLSGHASSVGQEAAEVRGAIDDTDKAAKASVDAVSGLARRLDDVDAAQTGIDTEAQASIAAVAKARMAVEQVGGEVSRIVDSLREVGQAAAQITQIALQTRLVAFNASVEAKRAGDAGRGFGVVADAVRDLAGRVEASSQQIMGTMKQLDARVGSLAAEIQRRDASDSHANAGKVHQALSEVDITVQRIQQATEASRQTCDGLRGQMGRIQEDLRATSRVLGSALGRTDTLLQISERLIETVADAGVETTDTPYIQAVQDAAKRVSQQLAEAVQAGKISVADLFDENYVALPGTNPAQHTTRFCALAERLFPTIQEPLLELSPKVVYCIAVDRNGYVPMHNRKYSQPQRADDVAWNTANSRYRRIFNDRTGLASARNQRPFLLQTYRRDMGGGHFVVMKEAAAPITVAGRHWGGVRLAYQF